MNEAPEYLILPNGRLLLIVNVNFFLLIKCYQCYVIVEMEQPVWLLQRIINHDTNPIIIKEGLYKIGRSPESNIFCKSEWVSRFHCDVTVKGGNVYIKDLGSLNGTYIEQTEILKERDLQLKNGDIISLGKPFLGDMPETGHYVYRLVACNEPPEPKKRKRIASLSPNKEEQPITICSPKRIRESIEKQIKDPLTKLQDSTPKQEILLEKNADYKNKRNASSKQNSVSINQVSSSDKEMESIECIDLTNDDCEQNFPNKASSSGSLANEGFTSPDSSDFKNPIFPILNDSSLDTNAKIVRALMTILQNHESDKVLKNIEMLSAGVGKPEENIFHKTSAHNQSTAESSSSNMKFKQIISSNVSISNPGEYSTSSQSAEVTNYCSTQNNIKIKADVDVNSVQPIHTNKEYVLCPETNNILNVNPCNKDEQENKIKSEYELQAASKADLENQYEAEVENQCKADQDNQVKTEFGKQSKVEQGKGLGSIQPPSNLIHCLDSNSASRGRDTPIQSNLKSPNNGTGKVPNEEQNYNPQLKKSRSDSFTTEMDKLDSLLKVLNDPIEKGLDYPLNDENESKLIEGKNEFCKDSKKDNQTTIEHINKFHESIDTACGETSLSRKNKEDTSVFQLKNNATINIKQQYVFSEQDKVEEVKIASPSRKKPENDKLKEVKMDSPSRNKPEKNRLEEDIEICSPSRSTSFNCIPFGAEDNVLIRIKQETSSEQNNIEEPMVFSQDIDGVVVIDESEDELEYSQMFMEQDEAIKEVLEENTNICIKEEFLYEMNDDNEDMDLFQSHFSQCSQEQESIKEESPKKKKVKPKSRLSDSDFSSQKHTKVLKSPRSRGKHKIIRDVRVKLRRLDTNFLQKDEEKMLESNLERAKSDYPDKQSAVGSLRNNNEIVKLDTLEIIKCNDKNGVNLESLEILKKNTSNEVIESNKNLSSSIPIGNNEPTIELPPKKTEQSTKKVESDKKLKTKKTGSKKLSVDVNLVNCTESGRDELDAHCNMKLDLEKSVSRVGSIEPNENCPPSNLNKTVIGKPEINKQLELDGSAPAIASLPPPDSISGAKLVKSTLLSKPPTEASIRRKPGRPKKTESSVTKDSLNKKKQKQIADIRKEKLKSLALEANSKVIENGEKNNAHNETISRTEKGLRKRKVDEESPSSLSLQSKDGRLLAEKSVTRSGSPDRNIGLLTKPTGVAKITERNRGSILLEGLLENPCRKSRIKKKVEQANIKMKSTESVQPVAKQSTSYDKAKESVPTSSKADQVVQIPKGPSNGLKSCLKIAGRRSSVKKVEFDLKMNIKEFECEGILRSVNAMGLKDKAPSTPIPNPLASLAIPVITPLEETYFDIVHWNASWINEIKVIPGEPPVHAEKYNGKDSYVSYKDYKRWLYPLMLYELWANMCKTMDDEDANKTGRAFDGIVLETLQYGVHSTNGKNLLVLKCFFPLYGNQVQNMVEAMDILLIKALSAYEGKRIFFVMFGLVYSAIKINSYRDTYDPVARHFLTTLNRKPDACAYFDVIIYKSQQKQLTTGFQLRIRPTYNMMTELREFESLIKLASSPLSDIIIDPVANKSIYLQKDMNNKIVTQYPLNEEQRKAILCTSQSVFASKPNISLIHGPPGTGKTQVIVSLVEQLLYRFKLKNNYKRKKILLCSHSNNAIDEICLRLLDIRQQLPREKRFKLTRFGRKERMHPRVAEIQTATLARKEIDKRNLNDDFALELSLKKATERMVATALENPESPKAETYKRRYEQIQKRIASLEALINNKDSTNETRQKEIERMVFDEEMKVIYHSDIIATTLGSCAQKRITRAFSEMSKSGEEKREVGVCIIDEATQATEADSLLPLVYDVKNFILVGDPQQLPPFVASQTAKKLGLCQSLFSRLYKVWGGQPSAPVYMLTAQHRMHPEIAKFPSKAFYNNQLTTPSFLAIKRPFKPYAIIMHTLSQESSETNLGEAKLIVEMAERFLLEPAMKGLSIGLIVPYQRQRSLIQDLFIDKKVLKQLSVNTIDSYQGQERDVILLSVVRTSGIGFLNDQQRLNVALTRAKKALYIVGNFTSLQTSDIWKELLTDARERNLQFDAGRADKVEDIFGFLFERNCKKSRTSNS